MGLNDSYAQTRAQILMLDPLPPISKVFALVVQEECQRSITHGLSSIPNPLATRNSNPSVTIVAATRNAKPKRERPLCSHCGIQGHTVDKCCKLHGYPPSYKFTSKAKETPQVNQAISTDSITSPESPLRSLIASQCQQLIALLNSQLHASSSATIETLQPKPSVSNIHGNHVLLSNSSLHSLPNSAWVLDTSATHHVCCFIFMELFVSSVQVSNSFVKLPNGQSVSIHRIGSMRISNELILTNVLFVPQFRFNLLSMSSLTQTHNYSVNFLTDSCVI